ncbi:MAG: ABC transporter permease [Planctomycetota bacterium]
MQGMWVIYKRELRSYFNTPIAYIFLPILVGFMSFWFFKYLPFFIEDRADMRNFFSLMPFVLFVFVPAITMRLWAEELRVGTAEILLTLPYKVPQIVIGKFLAAYTVLVIGLTLTLGITIGVGFLGDPDWGPIIGGYFGTLLMGAMFVALGAFISSLTTNQVVALLVGLIAGVGLVLFFSARTAIFLIGEGSQLATAFENIGVETHFSSIERGVVALSDVLYFVCGTVLFLFLNIFRVESRRY